MTVRANKPAFSIREKLKELQKPIGLKGSELMRSETAQEAGALLGVGRKNVIINGNQNIDQRNNGSATADFSGSGAFVTDRWEGYNANGGTISGQRVEDAPPGFKRSIKLTVGTAGSRGSTAFGGLYYTVEGFDAARFAWGTSGAKYAALSFWTKSSVPGLYTVGVRDNAFNSYYIATYYINSTNTWEYKTVTIPPATGGAFSAGNGIAFSLFFALDTGSIAHGTAVNSWVYSGGNKYATSGMAKLFATSGNTWYITGVQMEVGKNATEFEHRSYGEELALCQRYFLKLGGESKIMGMGSGTTISTTQGWGVVQFPVTMRTYPTAALLGGTGVTLSNGTVFPGSPTLGTQYAGTTGAMLTFGYTAGTYAAANQGTVIYTQNGATDGLTFNAEL